jgi:hypothetical protein
MSEIQLMTENDGVSGSSHDEYSRNYEDMRWNVRKELWQEEQGLKAFLKSVNKLCTYHCISIFFPSKY